jgi:hypothetical protein
MDQLTQLNAGLSILELTYIYCIGAVHIRIKNAEPPGYCASR